MNFFRKRKIAAAKKKEAVERRECLLRNGRFMLEELISSFNGKSNPIRSFSASVILKAMIDSTVYSCGGFFNVYKCIIDDLRVLVKWSPYQDVNQRFNENVMKGIARDIAVSSQMSSHKNVLKLLGCCLEFPYPVLVYEYVEKGQLCNYDYANPRREMLPWNIRLKIAKETAFAVSYLHTAFPERMVHRDIKPENIFLDEKWTAKVCDFSLSITIPDGEPHVELPNTFGPFPFPNPAFIAKSCVNESTDVYSFGTILLILITGKPFGFSYEIEGNIVSLQDCVADARGKGQFIEILDPELVDSAAEETLELQQMQWKAFMELALQCVRHKREDRPDMIEVAKELVRIEKSTKLSDMILDKECEPVAPPLEWSGNVQTQRDDNRQHSFHYFLREYQSLLGLMLIFYLLLQWNV